VTLKTANTMKNLVKIALFSFVMILGMGSMTAQTLQQDQNSPEVVAKQKTAKLSEMLNLTGDQQRAVFRALVVKENNYNKYVNGKDAKSAEVMAAKKKQDEILETSMKKALTNDQFQKWKSLSNQ
tara:strand:- start:18405 stop:18779 length:375 start_codon:yes stop_codon:yes gene_type:complete